MSSQKMTLVSESKPHCCPICSGTGTVPNGFYRQVSGQWSSSSDATPEQCRSCRGTGIVWEQKFTHLKKEGGGE